MRHGERVSDGKGRYRINVVAKMTGLSAATLRAWERRYGIPVPARTESSYRIYTDSDVALIRRMRALCDTGMSPSEAAEVVLVESRRASRPTLDGGDPFAPFHARIVDAVDAFDPTELERAVDESLALGPAAVIYDRVFAPAMREIGERWHNGTLSVGQEHLATQTLEAAARKLMGLVQPPSGRRVLLACFADEDHAFPLYGVALHLAAWGFRVVTLGARTPASAIRQAVERLEPVLVGLSVTNLPAPHDARTLVADYAAACAGTPWIVGGRAAPSLRDLVERRGGSIAPTDSPTRLLRAVETLIARGRAARAGGHDR